jgi:hypothetical protein
MYPTLMQDFVSVRLIQPPICSNDYILSHIASIDLALTKKEDAYVVSDLQTPFQLSFSISR